MGSFGGLELGSIHVVVMSFGMWELVLRVVWLNIASQYLNPLVIGILKLLRRIPAHVQCSGEDLAGVKGDNGNVKSMVIMEGSVVRKCSSFGDSRTKNGKGEVELL
ncbi:hypothetical protein HAX54_041689 [Datura stramonium]|uniref:Uncharacterized protein n=1 Tax=Datura stramonium TaxID=4076 RepID=A0ABS8W2X4_DATST|nr:hypothetical protein [Datura stramonium]